MKKIATLLFSLFLAACGNSNSQLEGNWIGTDNGRTLMTIERNNDEYLVRLKDTKRPNDQNPPVPAILENGKLVMRSGGSTVTYIKATNTAVVSNVLGGLEFSRAN